LVILRVLGGSCFDFLACKPPATYTEPVLEKIMPEFVRLATQSELPAEGEAKEFPCGDKVICVANVNGSITAMDNVCLHRGGPLGQGMIEGDKVVCPWHGWQWDPKTGEAAHNPNAKVAVYPLKVENGDVLVEV
jgi:nitrite reductase (NADH) small subunit